MGGHVQELSLNWKPYQRKHTGKKGGELLCDMKGRKKISLGPRRKCLPSSKK